MQKPKALLTKIQKEKVALITDLGEPQRAYSALLKLSRTVKGLNSDQCLDYGNIQQVMGSIFVVKPMRSYEYEEGDSLSISTELENIFQPVQLRENEYLDEVSEAIRSELGCVPKQIYGTSFPGAMWEPATYVHANSQPDHAYADFQLTGVKYAIARESIQYPKPFVSNLPGFH